MTYDEAKSRQIDCFKEGVYVMVVYLGRGDYFLRDCTKEEAERAMIADVVSVVKRTRLRVIPGGKKDAT